MRMQQLGLLFMLCLGSFTLLYAGFPVGDLNEHYPLLLEQLNGTFENDWFVSSHSGFNVRFFHLQVLLGFTLLFGGDLGFTLMCFLVSFVSILGLFALGKKLSDVSGGYIIALLGSIVFGYELGYTYAIHQLIPTTIGIMLTIWALYAFYNKYYTSAFALAGVSTIFHITYGPVLFGFLVLMILARKIDMIAILKGTVVYFVISSINVIPIFFNQLSSSLSSAQAVHLMAFLRHPHILLPTTWSILHFAPPALYILIFFLCLSQIKHKKIPLVIFATTVVYFLSSMLFTYWVAWDLIVKLQLFKAYIVFQIIALVVIGLYINDRFKKGNWIVLVIPFLLASEPFAIIALVIIASDVFKLPIWLQYVGATLGLALITFLAGYHTFVLSKLDRLLSVLLAPLFIGMLKKSKLLIGLGCGIIVLLVLVYPPVDRYSYASNLEDVYDIVDTLDQNAIFLTPPDLESFRVATQRPIVVTFKAFPFRDDLMIEWFERMSAVGKQNTSLMQTSSEFDALVAKGYSELTTQEVIALQTTYNISYMLTDNNHVLDFDVIYSNPDYVIYELPR